MKKLVISTLFVMQVFFGFAQATTGITGKVVDEFGFLSIEVIEIHHLAYIVDPRFAETSEKTNTQNKSKSTTSKIKN